MNPFFSIRKIATIITILAVASTAIVSSPATYGQTSGTLTQPTQMPIVMGGKVVGNATVPKGLPVRILQEQNNQVLIAPANASYGQTWVPKTQVLVNQAPTPTPMPVAATPAPGVNTPTPAANPLQSTDTSLSKIIPQFWNGAKEIKGQPGKNSDKVRFLNPSGLIVFGQKTSNLEAISSSKNREEFQRIHITWGYSDMQTEFERIGGGSTNGNMEARDRKIKEALKNLEESKPLRTQTALELRKKIEAYLQTNFGEPTNVKGATSYHWGNKTINVTCGPDGTYVEVYIQKSK